ncbi:MAG: protoheme IX farnesyltransferase [Salibacteraceae bacterium]|jgi:protoheme IX farnesyltransferase
MIIKTREAVSVSESIMTKVKVYAAFTKLRLASLVVFSAVISYLYAAPTIDLLTLTLLSIGGFLITGAANGMNQIIEKDFDKLMDRTADRPIPSGQMSVTEGLLVVAVSGIIGILMLGFFINPLSGLLGAMAMIMYAGIYTPMKRKTSWAVIVGAFPGAIPPLLGYVAYTGKFGLVPGILFIIQFAWQLPHFWSIAWKLDADYKKGGFTLLPFNGVKDATSAWVILLTSLLMIPAGLLPFYFGETSIYSGIVITFLALWMVYYSVKLVQTKDDKMALKIMFASFAYLPLTQLALMFDKIFLM